MEEEGLTTQEYSKSLDKCLCIIEKQTRVIELLIQNLSRNKRSKDGNDPAVFSPTEPLSSAEKEMENLFMEECEKKASVLEKGKKIGVEPSFTISGGSGKYFTNQDLERISEKKKTFEKLSRADELDIIHHFEPMVVGKNYYEARETVEAEGYSLHPIYVNDEDKQESLVYSGTVLGVKVEDPSYNHSMKILSPSAVIVEIVDVGGQDPHNRGRISL